MSLLLVRRSPQMLLSSPSLGSYMIVVDQELCKRPHPKLPPILSENVRYTEKTVIVKFVEYVIALSVIFDLRITPDNVRALHDTEHNRI